MSELLAIFFKEPHSNHDSKKYLAKLILKMFSTDLHLSNEEIDYFLLVD